MVTKYCHVIFTRHLGTVNHKCQVGHAEAEYRNVFITLINFNRLRFTHFIPLFNQKSKIWKNEFEHFDGFS